MSMPQYLTVAVISGKLNLEAEHNFGGEKSSAVAAILKGKDTENRIAPAFIPIAFGKCRSSLVQFGILNGFTINHNPAYPRLINPEEITIWLALDKEGVQQAQERIKQGGSSSNEFYREVFPETVMRCGFSVPNPPIEPDFQDWFNLLTEKFKPWKQRIWNAFYESS
jgi:hypothetical protein